MRYSTNVIGEVLRTIVRTFYDSSVPKKDFVIRLTAKPQRGVKGELSNTFTMLACSVVFETRDYKRMNKCI